MEGSLEGLSLEDEVLEKSKEELNFEDLDLKNDSLDELQEDIKLDDLGIGSSDIDELSLDDVGLTQPDLTLDLSADVENEDSVLEEKGIDFDMSDELNLGDMGESDLSIEDVKLEDLDFDNLDFEDLAASTDKSAETDMGDDLLVDIDDVMDDMDKSEGLDDVLNILEVDADSDLAEINNMLEKSDSAPVEDDMMSLLSQMADEEEASISNSKEDVTKDVVKEEVSNTVPEDETEKSSKKKKKKEKKRKVDKEQEESKTTDDKKPGALSKLFNILTEDLVPEPTEEELAAEKAQKDAKKQEKLTQKEAEKAAKEEEKKVKDEEKAAAKKAKEEAAAQKKKEKADAKAAKLAKKQAEAAAHPKKRIPPKKFAFVTALAASILGAVIVSTNILSEQGYLQVARAAYYDEDYQTVYLSTYDIELGESDALIQARSKAILKMQRKYDSYNINLKIGRKLEAVNALIEGIKVYDLVNAEAQQYGVSAEVEAIKADILNALGNYGIDEAKARELLGNEDSVSYTLALNELIY